MFSNSPGLQVAKALHISQKVWIGLHHKVEIPTYRQRVPSAGRMPRL